MSKIMVISKRRLPFGATDDEVWEAIHDHAEFLDRTPELEADESFLQICSYTVIKKIDDNSSRVLAYQRSKKVGDTRLQGKLSIGFGGHVELQDLPKDTGSPSDAIHTATIREIHEELGLRIKLGNFRPLGMLYTPEDPVSRVHLGMVSEYVWDFPIEPQELLMPSEEVTLVGWRMCSEVGQSYEIWSQAVAKALQNEPLGGSRLWLPQR
jgi:predicted NUDIX family phosphoesterase